MSNTKKSRLPIGIKEKPNDSSNVLQELEQMDWLHQIPVDKNYFKLPFPYGTRHPVFR